MSKNEPNAAVYSRQNFLSIYIPAMTLAVGTGIAIPALPIYAKSFDVSFEVASLVIIVQQLGTTASSVPIGLLMDRIGRRWIVLLGPLVLAASSIGVAFAGSFPELLVYRAIGGIGQQMWLLGRLTMIADTGADRSRGRQITTMHAMESTGRLASPAIGGFLAAFWDIRAPFIAHAILSLIAIIPSFVLVKETAPEKSSRGRAAADDVDAGWRAILVYPVLIFFFAQFLASLTRGPIFAGQLNLYAAYSYDVGPQDIGVLATIVTTVGIPIGLLSGYIMDRFGRKATLVPGFSLLALALLFMMVTAFVHLPFMVFVVAYILVYGTNSITGGNMQTLGSDIAPANARGRFYGVWHTMGSVGSPVSTSAFALLSAGAGYASAFAFLGVSALGAALILGTQVRDKLREKPAVAAQPTATSR
ncbi:MAG: transporter [Chloroflexi bacterium]|nr:transporter [Chloroflexota bacterium]